MDLKQVRENIRQYGSLYPPSELPERMPGKPFDPGYCLDCPESRCRDIRRI